MKCALNYLVYATWMQSLALFHLAQQRDALRLLVIPLKIYEAAVRFLPREPL